jgi:transcriptional regulator with XRE-family HTH domain
MAHPKYLRDKALQLRTERRLTIDEIAERLALSRSTIYYWLRDEKPLGTTPRRSAAQLRAARAHAAKWRRLRDAAYAEGQAAFDELCAEPSFRDFVTLYVAEGYKRNRNRVAIGNSDPTVISVAVWWLRRLSTHPLTFAIQYHADQDLAELRAFWGHQLGIDGDTISLQRKSNSNQLRKRTWRSQYGVLTVTVNDTLLRARLQGWIDSAKEEWTRLAA